MFRQEAHRLWRALYGYTGRADRASDAVAEAFAQVMHRGDDVREVSAWVWKAAFRIARRRARVAWREIPLPDNISYEMSQPLVDLMAGLRKLPDRQRAAILLHHYAGYSTREVADIIGSTPGSVRVQLSRARASLRRILGGEYVSV